MTLLRIILVFATLASGTASQQVPASSLRGSVVSWGGDAAVEEAEIELVSIDGVTGPGLITVSRENGEFRLAQIPPGRYRLYATKAGYARAEYGQRRPGGVGTPITVRPGEPLTDVRILIASGGAVSGRVVDRRGAVVAGASIHAIKVQYPDGQAALTRMQSAVTNDLGEYRLFWLTPGLYYFFAQPINLQTYGRSIVINPDSNDTAVPSVLYSSRMTARVPRPVGLEENEIYAPVYFPDTTDLAAATLIEVRAGEDIRDLNFNVFPMRSVRIQGSVVDPETGAAAPDGTRVSLRSLAAGSSPRTVQMVDGEFLFPGITAGAYDIRAEVPATGQIGRATIEVHERDLNFSLSLTSFAVAGRIATDSALDVGNARVLLRSAPGFEIAAPISANGAFALPRVPDGLYEIYVSGLRDPDAYLKSVRSGASEILREGLYVRGMPPEPLELSIGMDGGSIAGRVVNAAGDVVPFATVVILPDVDRPFRLDLQKSAMTSASGEFRLLGIAPGAYNLYAWEDVEPNAWLDPGFIRLYRDRAIAIRISDRQRLSLQVSVIP